MAARLRERLLGLQAQRVHPFTRAAPGGWAWTDRPGGVPDADDTSGALLALRRLGPADERARRAEAAGLRWLLDLQNADGGMPTFCRGWGRLPFDRSCPDITAHALSAFDEGYDDAPRGLRSRLDRGLHAAVNYLEVSQREDGAWVPLWFGNQAAAGGENPVYGTARVVRALRDVTPERLPRCDMLVERGMTWLAAAANPDGGWGGSRGVAASVEETAVAVEALAGSRYGEAAWAGARWLVERTADGREFPAAPIGLYFASLWYSERLYPMIFTVAALGRLLGSAG